VSFRRERLRRPIEGADACAVSTRVQHPESSKRLVVASFLVAPAAIFVGANVLQYGIGVSGAADWLDPVFEVAGLEWLATALVLSGPVVALLLAATRFLPIRLVRDGDVWEMRIRVRTDWWAIAIGAISVLVGGILAGHLVAENLACVIGLRSRC
jgi:hypothetical protein